MPWSSARSSTYARSSSHARLGGAPQHGIDSSTLPRLSPPAQRRGLEIESRSLRVPPRTSSSSYRCGRPPQPAKAIARWRARHEVGPISIAREAISPILEPPIRPQLARCDCAHVERTHECGFKSLGDAGDCMHRRRRLEQPRCTVDPELRRHPPPLAVIPRSRQAPPAGDASMIFEDFESARNAFGHYDVTREEILESRAYTRSRSIWPTSAAKPIRRLLQRLAHHRNDHSVIVVYTGTRRDVARPASTNARLGRFPRRPVTVRGTGSKRHRPVRIPTSARWPRAPACPTRMGSTSATSKS